MNADPPPPTRVARYQRLVEAPLSRVWENVFDWEHLPWLHRESFRSIELIEAGPWGWRAQVGLPPAGNGRSIRLELLRDGDADRYVARTLEGPGAGSEIWTTLEAVEGRRTRVEVAFHVPGVEPGQAEALGRGFVALYTRLWDQDEAMMRRREALLDAHAAPAAPPASDGALDLGAPDALRRRLPLRFELAGLPWRLVELDGELVAHSALCPHMLGPLENAPLEGGRVVCPWHGYRFDPRSGRCAQHPKLRLPPAPRVEIDSSGSRVRVVAAAPAPAAAASAPRR